MWLILSILAIGFTSARCDPGVLFPYGETEGDSTSNQNDDWWEGPIAVDPSFDFFGTSYESLWVNTNGVVSFGGGVWKYTPYPFPSGYTMVAPFWADVDTRYGVGNIFFRFSTDTEILKTLTKEIKSYFKYSNNFKAKRAFIVTWDQVEFYGGHWSSNKRNTFQLVLTSDNRYTFAVYNYDSITWTTGVASGGDSYTGLGGYPVQVGFDAGDSVNYHNIQGSGTDAMLDLPNTSNVGVPGRYVFRIDGGMSGYYGSEDFVQMKLLGPRRAMCVVRNRDNFPLSWDGIRWYNPQGGPADDVPGLNVHMSYTSTASGHGFWTSTLTLNGRDQRGRFVCEVNYNNEIIRVGADVDSDGCPPGQFACSNGRDCLPCPRVCNGVNDCGDNSDEDKCERENPNGKEKKNPYCGQP